MFESVRNDVLEKIGNRDRDAVVGHLADPAAGARVALDRLGEHSGATIRLHPEDFEVATGGDTDWESEQVNVVSDENVSRGGCRIESAFGFVEASVEAQFEEIERAVLTEAPSHAMVAQEETVAQAEAVAEEDTVPQE